LFSGREPQRRKPRFRLTVLATDFAWLRAALLDPRTHKPAIALGIAGRTPDGWYDLGEISVEDGSGRATGK